MIEMIQPILARVAWKTALHIAARFMASKRNSNQLNVRLNEPLRTQFEAACLKTDETQSEVIRVCIKAFVEEVEREGEIRKPYAILSKKRRAELESRPPQSNPGRRLPNATPYSLNEEPDEK